MMRGKADRGFTLVELLVVIAIIGILAAVAIPAFNKYRIEAFNTRASNDIQALITGQEAYYVDHEGYLTCGSPELGAPPCAGNLPGVSVLSSGVYYLSIGLASSVSLVSASSEELPQEAFLVVACHEKGDRAYLFQNTSTNIDGLPTGVVTRASESCIDSLGAFMSLIIQLGNGNDNTDNVT